MKIEQLQDMKCNYINWFGKFSRVIPASYTFRAYASDCLKSAVTLDEAVIVS